MVDGCRERVFVERFPPQGPVPPRGAGGGVQGVVDAGRQQELGVGEEVGDFVFALIAQHLADSLLHGLFFFAGSVEIRAFTFDDDDGDAVDEEDNIRAAGLVAATPLDGEFLSDVVDVALRVLPINVVQAEALGIALDGLGEAGAQGEQFVDALAGGDEAVEGVTFVAEGLQGMAEVGLGEGVRLAFESDGVVSAEPLGQHVF